MAGEYAQVALDRGQLDLEHVDDLQRDPESLGRVDGQIQGGEELAAGEGAQIIRGAGDAVVIEGRADPLDPAGALGQQRVAQPGARAPLPHVLGRAPRFRQPPLAQQLAQPLGIRAVGLGAALAAAQRAGLHRLGQMRHRAGALQGAADKQPTRARLDSNVHDPIREPADPQLDRRGRGLELTTPQLARHGVDRIKRDLAPMDVKPSDDRAGSDAEHERGAQHRLRGVTPDRCHTVIHGRYLQLRMTGGADCNRARLQPTSFDTEDRPPPARPTRPLRTRLLMPSFRVELERSFQQESRVRAAIAGKGLGGPDRAG